MSIEALGIIFAVFAICIIGAFVAGVIIGGSPSSN
jgi:hypothetical protein